MAQPIIVNDLVAEVRDLLDEDNTQSVSDVKIVRALNRSARNAYQIIAKQFDQIFMVQKDITFSGATLAIPEDAFGRRIEFITYDRNVNDVARITKVDPRKMHKFQRIPGARYPQVYTTEKDSILIAPTPIDGLTGTIHYMKKPSTLVKSQGRIVDITGDDLTVDTLGSDITTTVDDLGGFFSVIDAETGLVKGSFQVGSIDGSTITIKTVGLDRTTIYGLTIGTSIPSTVGKDDFICAIGGTCVLEIISDYSDYLTYRSMVDIKNSLRLPTSPDEKKMVDDMERHIETIWSGRENDQTVASKNVHWSPRLRGWRGRSRF